LRAPATALGERLREARRQAGLSQELACSKTGYALRSLTRWENSEAQPSFETVARLAECYGVSLDWIAGRVSHTPLVRAGQVMVDQEAIAMLKDLASRGRSLKDIPPQYVRHPGVLYGFLVPRNFVLLRADAADALEAHVQELLGRLKARP
jgi:transcriptional regulator with XRE-family HTH domain